MAQQQAYLVDVGALDLTHRNEVVGQQLAVVRTHTAHFLQTLVCEKCEFLAECLELLGLVGQHELEGDFLVAVDHILSADDLISRADKLPLLVVLVVEKSLFFVDEGLFFLNVRLFGCLADGEELAEGFVLVHVVLEVTAEIDLDQIAEVCDVVACTCHHLGEPCEQLLLAVAFDHSVELAQLLQELP